MNRKDAALSGLVSTRAGDRQVPSLLAGEEGMFYFLKKENVQIIKMVQIANPHARYLGESLILTPAPSDTQITAH